MLEPLRNPANWDNFRKVVVLVLIIWAAVSGCCRIIYFFILGGRSPAPANIFRALILACPVPAVRLTGSRGVKRRRRTVRMKGQQYVDNHAFKAKELVGDRGCRVGDFLYMAPIAVPSSLGNAIGIGATEESAKLDAETEAARTKAPLDQHQLFRVVSD